MRIKDLVGKKIAVHCKTREEAEKFCQIASQNGYGWRNVKAYCSLFDDCFFYDAYFYLTPSPAV